MSGVNQTPLESLDSTQPKSQDIAPVPLVYPSSRIKCPISPQKLNELRKGDKINVFVGERPSLDQVVHAFPVALLDYFCPTLRQQLRTRKEGKNYVIILPSLKKVAVGWFLRFVMAGGSFPISKGSPSADESDFLVEKLQVLLTLGFDGDLQERLMRMVSAHVKSGSLQWAQIEWMFQESAPGIIGPSGQQLVHHIADSIMEGTMTQHQHLKGCRQNKVFWGSMHGTVMRLNRFIWHQQHSKKIPLSREQVEFVMNFTNPGDRIRDIMCRGLVYLMDMGMVRDNRPYIDFSNFHSTLGKNYDYASSIKKYEDFNQIMTRAWERHQEFKKSRRMDRLMQQNQGKKHRQKAQHSAKMAPIPENSVAFPSLPVPSSLPFKRPNVMHIAKPASTDQVKNSSKATISPKGQTKISPSKQEVLSQAERGSSILPKSRRSKQWKKKQHKQAATGSKTLTPQQEDQKTAKANEGVSSGKTKSRPSEENLGEEKRVVESTAIEIASGEQGITGEELASGGGKDEENGNAKARSNAALTQHVQKLAASVTARNNQNMEDEALVAIGKMNPAQEAGKDPESQTANVPTTKDPKEGTTPADGDVKKKKKPKRKGKYIRIFNKKTRKWDKVLRKTPAGDKKTAEEQAPAIT